MKRIADLQTAYATQTTTEEHGKGEWVVYNTDEKEIYRFPKGYSEKEVMAALHFARKFELVAFNKGVNFQKDKNPKTIVTLQKMVANFENDRKQILDRNIILSNELEKLNKELDILTINN